MTLSNERYIKKANDLLARARVPISMLMADEGASEDQRSCAAELWAEINTLLGDV